MTTLDISAFKFKLDPTALQMALQEVKVTLSGYFYAVDFGPGMRPQHHRVDKHRRCSCYLGEACPAVQAVADYLRAGGERAPDPPPGYYPVAPVACPICGAATIFDNSLSSKRRGAGWRCTKGGAGHYWQAQVKVLKEKAAANPWIFPPVVVRGGRQINAWDGIQTGDQVLYSGVPK